jgi:hypothetical protein
METSPHGTSAGQQDLYETLHMLQYPVDWRNTIWQDGDYVVVAV